MVKITIDELLDRIKQIEGDGDFVKELLDYTSVIRSGDAGPEEIRRIINYLRSLPVVKRNPKSKHEVEHPIKNGIPIAEDILYKPTRKSVKPTRKRYKSTYTGSGMLAKREMNKKGGVNPLIRVIGIVGGIGLLALAINYASQNPQPTPEPTEPVVTMAGPIEDISTEVSLESTLATTPIDTTEPASTYKAEPATTPNEDYFTWTMTRIGDSLSFSEEQEVEPGDVLFLGASAFRVDDKRCYQNDDRICIYIKEVNKNEIVSFTDLTPGHSWLGIARNSDAEGVLEDRVHSFWIEPNCEVGCGHARVIMDHKDGCSEEFIVFPSGDVQYFTEPCE